MITQAFSATTALSDLIALTKPRLTSLVLLSTAGGALLSGETMAATRFALMLVGTALVVGASHALNMLLERDLDAAMLRTRDRPLPAGRLTPEVVVGFSVVLGLSGLLLLALWVNALAAVLSLTALVLYVLVYTPLKRRGPIALYVGAVPGAIPPLLGWVAASGRIEAPALVLFALMFLWQIPHFLGLALFIQEDYERAAIRTLPAMRGFGVTRRVAIAATLLLVPVSALLFVTGVSGPIYLFCAIALGLWLLIRALGRPGPGQAGEVQWGRRLFLASLVYLSLLYAAVIVDVVIA